MRLFVLIFSSAKLISFRVWCIFFQINRHAAVENNAHFFRVGHMYESSLFLPNFSAHLLNFTISQVTRTQNRKLAVKVTRSLHSLFSLEFRRLAAQGEARSVLTKGYIGDVLTETAKDLKRGWRFRTSSESEITDCHALLLINSLLNYVQKKKKGDDGVIWRHFCIIHTAEVWRQTQTCTASRKRMCLVNTRYILRSALIVLRY